MAEQMFVRGERSIHTRKNHGDQKEIQTNIDRDTIKIVTS